MFLTDTTITRTHSLAIQDENMDSSDESDDTYAVSEVSFDDAPRYTTLPAQRMHTVSLPKHPSPPRTYSPTHPSTYTSHTAPTPVPTPVPEIVPITPFVSSTPALAQVHIPVQVPLQNPVQVPVQVQPSGAGSAGGGLLDITQSSAVSNMLLSAKQDQQVKKGNSGGSDDSSDDGWDDWSDLIWCCSIVGTAQRMAIGLSTLGIGFWFLVRVWFKCSGGLFHFAERWLPSDDPYASTS